MLGFIKKRGKEDKIEDEGQASPEKGKWRTACRTLFDDIGESPNAFFLCVFIIIACIIFSFTLQGKDVSKAEENQKTLNDCTTISDVTNISTAIQSGILVGPPIENVVFSSEDDKEVLVFSYLDSEKTKTVPVDTSPGTKVDVVFGQGENSGRFLVKGWNEDSREYINKERAYSFPLTEGSSSNKISIIKCNGSLDD